MKATEILTVIESTAVMAGVCGTDPYRSMPLFLQQLKDLGFCGIQNFPTVGLIDGNFRKNLEATGMSYQKEVEMVRIARQMDLLTAPYVFNVDEAERMTKAGADVVVVHLGLTTGGSIGAGEGEVTLDDCVKTVQTIRDACVKIEPDIIVLCHGGPVSGEYHSSVQNSIWLSGIFHCLLGVEETRYVLDRVHGIHGFFGASSMERLPAETAIEQNARRFKDIDIAH